MEANEFVKKFGWEYAKERMEYCKGARLIGMEIDLERFVESHDYIECLGGYQFVKENLQFGYFGDGGYKDLIQKCLEDLESCR